MAAATRLTELLRTSPTANMPGLLVSRNRGSQVLVLQPGGGDIVAHERLRKSAACPAELPPPTMATGPVPQAWASAWVAA